MSLILVLGIVGADFPINISVHDQSYPVITHLDSLFYIFFLDMRYYSPDRSISCTRVSENGTVLDPQGHMILRDRAVRVAAASDGVNFLAVIQDSC